MHCITETRPAGLFYTSFDVGMDMIGESASLELLEAVDGTVDSLGRATRDLTKANALALDMIEFIRGLDFCIEGEDSMVEKLLTAESALKGSLNLLRMKRQAAFDDPELRAHHEEAVVEAYDRLIEISHETCTSCQALRWEIMEHNADFDEVDEEVVLVSRSSEQSSRH